MERSNHQSMDRLKAMSSTEPVVIVPAPDPGGRLYEPTVVQPVVQPVVAAGEPVAYVEPVPVPVDPYAVYPRDRLWGPMLVAGLVALLIGGAAGFLVGRATGDGEEQLSTSSTLAPTDTGVVDQAVVDQRVDDVLTLLLAQAEEAGQVVTPTPFAKLDQLLAMSAGGAGSQSAIDALTAERDQLAADVATLQEAATTLQTDLAAAQAERDNLQATVDGNESVQQADAARIAELQTELSSATTQLETAQRDLATVTRTLDQLNVQQVQSVVGLDIAEVRDIARANGWQLVELPVTSTTAAPNTVTRQFPAAGANMINGSVLYAEFFRTP